MGWKNGRCAKDDKGADCNKQAGLGKMSRINKRSGSNKCNQGGAKTSKYVSTSSLLFET